MDNPLSCCCKFSYLHDFNLAIPRIISQNGQVYSIFLLDNLHYAQQEPQSINWSTGVYEMERKEAQEVSPVEINLNGSNLEPFVRSDQLCLDHLSLDNHQLCGFPHVPERKTSDHYVSVR